MVMLSGGSHFRRATASHCCTAWGLSKWVALFSAAKYWLPSKSSTQESELYLFPWHSLVDSLCLRNATSQAAALSALSHPQDRMKISTNDASTSRNTERTSANHFILWSKPATSFHSSEFFRSSFGLLFLFACPKAPAHEGERCMVLLNGKSHILPIVLFYIRRKHAAKESIPRSNHHLHHSHTYNRMHRKVGETASCIFQC